MAIKILYIAGYGRSGSTILDIILSNHSEIVGVGEISYLIDEWNEDRICACGERYSNCEFWKHLYQTYPKRELGYLFRNAEHIKNILKLVLNKYGSELATYQKEQARIFEYIRRHSGKSIIIDSSKTARWCAGRPLALSKTDGLDIYLLHLVRNGYDTMYSLIKTGSNWALTGKQPPLTRLPALRAVLGWVSANIIAFLIGRMLGNERYLRIRYEDLVIRPYETFDQIGEFIGVDMEEIQEKLESNYLFNVGHQVGGNRLVRKKRIRLRRQNTPKGCSGLSIGEKLLFLIGAGWLQILFGYNAW